MMAHHGKHLLHELLREDQEPFQLKSYIAERRSQLTNKSSPITGLQVKKRKPIIPETSAKRGDLCKHACFLTFHHSPDVGKSPFADFLSREMSPCKSPAGAVFLHVPSRTAALLVEAAKRVKPKSQIKSPGFGLFGSLLRILKDRNKNKKRAISDEQLNCLINEPKEKEKVKWACGLEELDEIDGDFAVVGERVCASPFSPFRFSLHESPSSSGLRTPDLCSPVTSPSGQDKESYTPGKDSDNVHGVEEEKEQCSPVSVLDPFLEDDEHGSMDADADEDEDDYDPDCSYANIERAKKQLLERLRRFEKLALLDPVELEQKLLESSDDEYQNESVESEDDEPSSLYRKRKILLPTFNMKRLLTDHLTVEGKCRITSSSNKLVSSNGVEIDIIAEMIKLDFDRESNGRRMNREQVEETAAEVELAIFGLLIEEISEELFCNDQQRQEFSCVTTKCTLILV